MIKKIKSDLEILVCDLCEREGEIKDNYDGKKFHSNCVLFYQYPTKEKYLKALNG